MKQTNIIFLPPAKPTMQFDLIYNGQRLTTVQLNDHEAAIFNNDICQAALNIVAEYDYINLDECAMRIDEENNSVHIIKRSAFIDWSSFSNIS